jgi:hypothetical protein
VDIYISKLNGNYIINKALVTIHWPLRVQGYFLFCRT